MNIFEFVPLADKSEINIREHCFDVLAACQVFRLHGSLALERSLEIILCIDRQKCELRDLCLEIFKTACNKQRFIFVMSFSGDQILEH